MSRIVYFDLETTRTINVGDAEIIQIGAIGHDGQNPPEFNRFIYPRGNVIPKKFQKKGGSLIKHGVRLQNVQSLKDALVDFMCWLDDNFVNEDGGVILLAHGAYNGDVANLMRSLHKIRYNDIDQTIVGFSDTVESARYFYADLGCWKLPHLKKINGLGGSVSHDALADAKDLRNIINRMVCCEEDDPDLYFNDFVMKSFKPSSQFAMPARNYQEDLGCSKLSHLKELYGSDALADVKDLLNVINDIMRSEDPALNLFKFLIRNIKFASQIIILKKK